MAVEVEQGDLVVRTGSMILLAAAVNHAAKTPRMLANCDGTGLVDRLHYLAHRDDADANEHGFRTRCVLIETGRITLLDFPFIIEKNIGHGWYLLERGALTFIKDYGWDLSWQENKGHSSE